MEFQSSDYSFAAYEEPPTKRRRLDPTVETVDYSSFDSRPKCSPDHVQTVNLETTRVTNSAGTGVDDFEAGAGAFRWTHTGSMQAVDGNTPHPDDLVCFGMVSQIRFSLRRLPHSFITGHKCTRSPSTESRTRSEFNFRTLLP